MDTVSRWSSKADKYAKYRWDYAPQAIEAIFNITGISDKSVVADIGSGTGILSKHFLNRVRTLYAVEPSPEMRRKAVESLQENPSFCSIEGFCDATTLPDRSVDLITVGEALHWFVPEPTRSEFLRILKPGGWLAILHNRGNDEELNKATQDLCTEENGWNFALAEKRPSGKPMNFWYGDENFLKLDFPQSHTETCEELTGALSSNSSAPDEDNPCYANFVSQVKRIFDRYSLNGQINISFATELLLGQVKD